MANYFYCSSPYSCTCIFYYLRLSLFIFFCTDCSHETTITRTGRRRRKSSEKTKSTEEKEEKGSKRTAKVSQKLFTTKTGDRYYFGGKVVFGGAVTHPGYLSGQRSINRGIIEWSENVDVYIFMCRQVELCMSRFRRRYKLKCLLECIYCK